MVSSGAPWLGRVVDRRWGGTYAVLAVDEALEVVFHCDIVAREAVGLEWILM